MYACWEWGWLRVLRAWGRLGLIRLPPYCSRHLHDRTVTHPPTVLPASQPPWRMIGRYSAQVAAAPVEFQANASPRGE